MNNVLMEPFVPISKEYCITMYISSIQPCGVETPAVRNFATSLYQQSAPQCIQTANSSSYECVIFIAAVKCLSYVPN